MSGFRQEVRESARSLSRRPAFTIVAALTLAVGVATATTAFAIVDGVIFRELPFPSAERLVSITWRRDRGRIPKGAANTSRLAAAATWARSPALDAVVPYIVDNPELLRREGVERVLTASAPASFFTLLGARVTLGRLLSPYDDSGAGTATAVVSHTMWERRLGRDPAVIGRSITLAGRSVEVVGVMAPSFAYPPNVELWVNLRSTLSGPNGAGIADMNRWWVLGRVREGSTIDEARQTLDVLSRSAWTPTHRNWLPVVVPLQETFVGAVRKPLLLILSGSLLVLAIAAGNVAAMLHVRALSRTHDVAVRRAIGAPRWRIARQALIDAVLLGLLGSAVGTLLTLTSVPWVSALAKSSLPSIARIAIDERVLLTGGLFAILTAIAAGILPAIFLSRQRAASGLREGGGRSSTWAARQLRGGDVLCAAQLGLALLLLSSATVLARSFSRLVRVEPGYDPLGVVFTSVQLPSRYETPEQRTQWAKEVLRNVKGIPGVTSAAVATGIPLIEAEITCFSPPNSAEGRAPDCWSAISVSEEYLSVLRIPVRSGSWARMFEEPGTVAISERGAAVYFGDRRVSVGSIRGEGADSSEQVVALVGDTRQRRWADDAPPVLYRSYFHYPSRSLLIVARTPLNPASIVQPFQTAVRSVDRTVPLERTVPMVDVVGEALTKARLATFLVSAFAGAALLLSAIGTFGLLSHGVASRTREIGIRIALGAPRQSVLRMLATRVAVIVAIGLLVGIASAGVAAQLLERFVYEISPLDTSSLVAACLLLILSALVAAAVPARRATRIDPIMALRE